MFALPFAVVQAADLKPFSSDGCSGFPDGNLQQNQLWLNCCRAHDLAYWQGGSYRQRLDADIALEQCVALVGEPHIAKLMLAGVRVGGSPFWPTSFRWGYGWSYGRGWGDAEGWPYPRFYSPLTPMEKKAVKSLAPTPVVSPPVGE